MSVVIEFVPRNMDLKAASMQMHANLVDLHEIVLTARKRVDAAKDLPALLDRYASFLKRYHAFSGVFSSAYRYLYEVSLEHRPETSAAAARRVQEMAALASHISAISSHVGGRHPWLSIPDFDRTKTSMCGVLDAVAQAADFAALNSKRLASDSSPAKPGGHAA